MLNTILLIIAIIMIPATLIFINKINRARKAKESIPCCSYESPFVSDSKIPSLPKPNTYLIVGTWSESYRRYFKNKVINSEMNITDVCLIAESFTRNKLPLRSVDVGYVVYDITDTSNVKIIESKNISSGF